MINFLVGETFEVTRDFPMNGSAGQPCLVRVLVLFGVGPCCVAVELSLNQHIS